ncbi:MAG: hypothetical protein L6V79_05930 [Clostridium sp.]|nr:MAG: hypothetical protein L6V79_05930 [Clostridium sp.]
MNKFLDGLYERASKQNKTIALAEGFDKRAVKAAELRRNAASQKSYLSATRTRSRKK